jgi:hypothetical protein
MGLSREFIYWSHRKFLMGGSREFNGIVTKTLRICRVDSWSWGHNRWSREYNNFMWSRGHKGWSREHNWWLRGNNRWLRGNNRWLRGDNGWSRNHNGCVMRNLKGGHKTLTSQFLYHIFAVHFERVNFLVNL